MSEAILETGLKKRRPPAVPEGGAISKQHILDVAASMFCSLGYSETSMKQIATKVGMKPASLYYHFPSKEAILTEILDIAISSVFTAVKAKVDSLPKGTRPSRKILTALECHVRALYDKPDYTSTSIRCAGQIPKKTLRGALPMRDRYKKFWRGLFQEAAAADEIVGLVDPELLQPFLLHAVNRTLAWYDPRRGNVEELVSIVLRCFSGCFLDAPLERSRPRKA